MFRALLAFVLVAAVAAFSPARMMGAKSMTMAMDGNKAAKAIIAGVIGLSIAAPLPSLADGAVSISTVYRARTKYGNRILDLGKAVESGNFAAFEDKKAVNGFDLFISSSNAQKSAITKERQAKEKKIEADIFAAVKAKDASKLKAAYSEFIKVADLKSEYKPGELGQTDSSGYSPTWGTDKQYIYIR